MIVSNNKTKIVHFCLHIPYKKLFAYVITIDIALSNKYLAWEINGNYSSDCCHWLEHKVFIPPPQNVWGGAVLDSLCRVGRLVRLSVRLYVRPSPIRISSITPLLMEGFPSNLNDTFTSTRGCAEFMLPMCQLKVKVTVECQILNKQILDIMSCPLYKSYTNGRISLDVQSPCCPCVSSRSRSS